MSWLLWVKSSVTLLLVALIVIGSCKMMKMAGCGGRKPRPPRPPRIVTVGPFDVVRADSGASLTVKSGRRGERIVNLQYILIPPAPGPDVSKWVEVSRKHLEEMAGATVTVQYVKKRHLAVADLEWFENHMDTCPLCSRPPSRELLEPWCDETNERMKDVVPDSEVLPDDGLESRGLLTGTVFGASGINLNLLQIEGGYCQCQPDAPKDWLKAEAEAKAKKRGLWSSQ